jgi:hypothetical protein
MKKSVSFFRNFLLLSGLIGITSCLIGCVSEKLNAPTPKQTKIGVVSLLGKSQFVLDENSAPTKVIGPYNHFAYAHALPGEDINSQLAENIVQDLHQKGYTNVAVINLPPKSNPVEVLKNQPDFAMILVISPDDGRAPALHQFAEKSDDMLFGYGAYFEDEPKNQHTFAYMNYDVSIYSAKDLNLMSTAFYSQSTELPFSPFASDYHALPNRTVAALKTWVSQDASPVIQAQALQALNTTIG